MMNIITNNPYRILGVYANSRLQEILANKSKATAFLNVNRPVEYPLDLKEILPLLSRTLDMMNEAEAHLAIASEQIKYAQFWFLKMTPIDDVAFNHLVAGNMSMAKEMWSKQESLSSLQNKIVCYLIENKPRLAVRTAEKLYERYGNSYVSKVDANCTLKMTASDLLHQFIDSLGEEVGMPKLLSYELGEEVKTYVSNQAVGPLIAKISSEVNKAKKVDHQDPNARINAAKDLETSTKDPLKQLKNLLPSSDTQLQMVADKLGLEILQCSIDYFNNSEDVNAPYTAMVWLKYAQAIVVGTLAKQRCEENMKVLQKIIDELPPKEVIAENSAIKAELSKFVKLPDRISFAVMLLNKTKPHLQSIKNKLGATNSYYLKLSTQIVNNALHNVIEEVNAVQLTSNMFAIESTLNAAWKATMLMDEFDMEADFKSHYNKNRSTLESMCNSLGITTSVGWPSTISLPTSPIPATSSTSTRRITAHSRPLYNDNKPKGSTFGEYMRSKKASRWQAALIITVIAAIIGYANDNSSYYDDINYGLLWGIGIGAITWLFVLYDIINNND